MMKPCQYFGKVRICYAIKINLEFYSIKESSLGGFDQGTSSTAKWTLTI